MDYLVILLIDYSPTLVKDRKFYQWEQFNCCSVCAYYYVTPFLVVKSVAVCVFIVTFAFSALMCLTHCLRLFFAICDGNWRCFPFRCASPSQMSGQETSWPCCCYSCCPADQLITNVWLPLRKQSVRQTGLISPAGGPLKPNHQEEKKKKKSSQSDGSPFSPLLPAVWSALCAVFTFFASFCSSAFWKSFIPMACGVDTVGIRL